MGDIEAGSHVRAYPGETSSGDAVIIRTFPTRLVALLFDALGHGPRAATIASTLIGQIETSLALGPGGILRAAERILRGSDGGALGVVVVSRESGEFEFTGTGNVVCRRLHPRPRHLVSQDGVVGVRPRKPRISKLQLEDRDILLMHSDGVQSRFQFSDVRESFYLSPTSTARQIVERFGRITDDASCVVLRWRSQIGGGP
jgi:hypothetical protein